MLFNTLAYGKFFGFVFVLTWVLSNRRWAPLLPWFILLGYTLATPLSPLSGGLTVLAFGLSAELSRRAPDDATPTLRVAAASVAVNFVALAFLTFRAGAGDPLSVALGALGVPLHAARIAQVAGLLAAPALLLLLVRARKVRLVCLLIASYVFYAHWDWRFLPLIFGSSTIDYLLGRAIDDARTERTKKLWIIGTVIVNLGVLGIFKYFNFGIESARAALMALGFEPPDFALRIALPIGISFFTFESMSYVIDVYRGEMRAHRSYLEYLTFVAFFPHLVAGPIVRPRDLLPQLAEPARFSPTEGSEGLFLVATGLLKKMVIGDYLALNLVDRVFDAPFQYSSLECYVAVLGYAVQIYCDFSGYTDIAIGSALLLGVRFPLNFDAPYKAHNLSNFWRRWHISLSTWLRDYLYIPLGGNRRGRVRRYLNLALTMLLGGLWHGASWTFVVWGGLHGGALALTHWYGEWRRRPELPRAERMRAEPRLGDLPLGRAHAAHLVKVLLTFHFVCACWIFFRAETFRKAWTMFTQLFAGTTFHPNLAWQVLAVLAVGLATHFAPERWALGARQLFIRLPAPAQGLALFAAALTLHAFSTAEAVPFVYFQF